MTAPGFRLVSQHVARNPIARAVGNRRLEIAVRNFATRLYLLDEGECVESEVQAAATVLAVALRIVEDIEPTWNIRVMHSGMATLTRLAQRDFVWCIADANLIDAALSVAIEIYQAASAQQTQDAHNFVIGLQTA